MEAVQKTPEREAFYKKIDGQNLSALWNVMNDIITPEPRSACQPFLWKFDEIRDYMNEAGKLITAKEAERRVLVLEIPACAASPRSRPRCSPACRWWCPATSRPRIATASRRCASCSKAGARRPRSPASAR